MKPHTTTNTDRCPKILALFIHRYRWGEQIRGDERGFLEKARRLKSLGTKVYVLELEPSIQENLNESIYTSLKIQLKLKTPRGPFEQAAMLFHLIRAAFRLSSKIDYDVIYAYNQDIENVIPAYLLKLTSRKPLIIVFHLLRSKEVAPFKDAVFVRLRKGFSPLAALLASLLDIAKRIAYRGADLYISVSHAVKNDLARHLRVYKVVVAQNGVDSSKFRPYDLEKIYDSAFLGRLHPQKGIETLLRAWKLILTENRQAKLLLIGGGDKDHIKHYRNLIHKLNLEENVVLTGWVPDEEMVRLLGSSKTFVFPSRYDGFALSVAEAMACGLPCIVSDIPALRENYGEVAIFAKADDVNGLAEAIVQLLKDKDRQRSLGRNAREYVKKFNWGEVVKRELKAISDLLGRSP